MQTVDLDRWRGRRDEEVMEPEGMAYRDQAATRGCRGCVFDGQWSPVCIRASAAAVRAGFRDCDAGVIYVAVEVDPRQLPIIQTEGTV